MGKLQKRMFVLSVISILFFAILLCIFLLQEEETLLFGEETKDITEILEFSQENFKENIKKEQEETVKENISTESTKTAEGNPLQESTEMAEGNILQESPLTQSQEITMIFTGDVLLDSSSGEVYEQQGITGIISESLQQEMVGADLTMINQEFPFSTKGTKAPDKQYTFRVNPEKITALMEMGVDVVTLANNHALDYGTEALEETFQVLDQAQISYVGAGNTKERAAKEEVKTFGDTKVGIVAASRVIPVVSWNVENQQPGLFCTYDSARLVEAIKRTREKCDYLVVYVHWGVEKKEYPEEYQRILGKEYIDAGADLVVGSHPHVPQGIEYYQGKPIVYSLGNFIFNSSIQDTYLLKVVLKGEQESQLSILPIGAENSFTSEKEGEEREQILRYIQEISYGIIIEEDGTVKPSP